VRVEPKTITIVAVMRNCYTTRSTHFEWQTDPFIWIASGQAYPWSLPKQKALEQQT